jgi:hypothetical protein
MAKRKRTDTEGFHARLDLEVECPCGETQSFSDARMNIMDSLDDVRSGFLRDLAADGWHIDESDEVLTCPLCVTEAVRACRAANGTTEV